MATSNICPACASNTIKDQTRIEELFDVFAGTIEVSTTENICETCGTSGDFNVVNDDIINEALESLKIQAAQRILEDFTANNFSLAGMERSLDLPQRTLTKWKNGGKPSAAGLTLLKYLRRFPWLLEVADEKFEFHKSNQICAEQALKIIAKQIKFTDPLLDEQDSLNNSVIKLEMNFTINNFDNPTFKMNSEMMAIE